MSDCYKRTVKNYGYCILEAGYTEQYLFEVTKYPDHDNLLPIFKMMMFQMKAKNPRAKYPLELMRLLVQHYSLLPMKQTCQVLHSLFVNNSGEYEYIFEHKVMEWGVKTNTSHT